MENVTLPARLGRVLFARLFRCEPASDREFVRFFNDQVVRKLLAKTRLVDHYHPRRFLFRSGDGLYFTGYGTTVVRASNPPYFERLFLKIIEKVTRRGMCRIFVDVGAGIGLFTIRVGKLLEAHGGRVVALEPDPRQFLCLIKNVRFNRLRNVTVLRLALGDCEGELRLTLYDVAGWSSLYAIHGTGRKLCEVTVRVVTFDSLVKMLDLPSVDVVKIDVEGAEVTVLEGARQVLSLYKPHLVVEVHGRENLVKVQELLRKYSYVVKFLGAETRFTDVETFYIYARPRA